MKRETTDKEIFSSRFREITKGYKNTEVAKILGKSLDTINKWRSDTNNHMPDTAGILSICKAFNCDPNYLFIDDADRFNSQYGEISDITGLSSKSIAVLQQLHKRSEDDTEALAWKNIDFINLVLEDMYGAESFESILTMIYDYTHPDDISAPDNQHAKYPKRVTMLIRSAMLDDIHAWMHAHTTVKPKDEYASMSIEEFDAWYQEHHKIKDRQ